MDSTIPAASCGVSRSGRVRKKPAKLMEMDLSMDDRFSSSSAVGGNYVANRTAALSSALTGCASPLVHRGPTSPPSQPSPLHPVKLPVVHRVQAPQLVSPSAPPHLSPKTPTRISSSSPDFTRTLMAEQMITSPRALNIKSLQDASPTFDHVSGSSTYLIGDDVHFITGEPVDSDEHSGRAVEDEDDRHHRGGQHQNRSCNRYSPLKIDTGKHVLDETPFASAIQPMVAASSRHRGDDQSGGDGLRMKFILSPKTNLQTESSFDTVKGGQSKLKKSKKSSKSHSKKSSSSSVGKGAAGVVAGEGGGGGNNGCGIGKSKKKKKSKQEVDTSPSMPPTNLYSPSDSFRGMPVLEVLAAGRLPPGDSRLPDTDSDNVDNGDSKLVIAEAPTLKSMVSAGKSKKRSSADGSKSAATSSKLKKKSGSSSKSNKKKQQQQEKPVIYTSAVAMTTTTADVHGQQHSVYLKEKNASKKKSGRKASKIREKGSNYKARPMSAYMLWSREYRSLIVKENPGIDFSAISKRLGEVWQSLTEFEKQNWRRKAKVTSCNAAAISNVINTGKKKSEKKTKVPKRASACGESGPGGGKMQFKGGEMSSKTTTTMAAAATAAAAVAAAEATAAALRLSEEAGQINKPVGTTPLDVAAHLKLLGESLSIIGQRLTEHEICRCRFLNHVVAACVTAQRQPEVALIRCIYHGQIAVSGSLSVLLDSTLCALGPLLCLTGEVDQLDGCAKPIQERILDNIAYIMPGL